MYLRRHGPVLGFHLSHDTTAGLRCILCQRVHLLRQRRLPQCLLQCWLLDDLFLLQILELYLEYLNHFDWWLFCYQAWLLLFLQQVLLEVRQRQGHPCYQQTHLPPRLLIFLQGHLLRRRLGRRVCHRSCHLLSLRLRLQLGLRLMRPLLHQRWLLELHRWLHLVPHRLLGLRDDCQGNHRDRHREHETGHG